MINNNEVVHEINALVSHNPDRAVALFKEYSDVFSDLSEETRGSYEFVTKIFDDIDDFDRNHIEKSLWNDSRFMLDRIKNKNYREWYKFFGKSTTKFASREILHAFIKEATMEHDDWFRYFDPIIFDDPKLVEMMNNMRKLAVRFDGIHDSMSQPTTRTIKFPFPKYEKLFHGRYGCVFGGSAVLCWIDEFTDIKSLKKFISSDIDIFIRAKDFINKIMPRLEKMKITYIIKYSNYTSFNNIVINLLKDNSGPRPVVMPKFQFIIADSLFHACRTGTTLIDVVSKTMDYPVVASTGVLTGSDLEIRIPYVDDIKRSIIRQQLNTSTKPGRLEKWTNDRGFTQVGDFNFKNTNFEVTPRLFKYLKDPTIEHISFSDVESAEYVLETVEGRKFCISLNGPVATEEWTDKLSELSNYFIIVDTINQSFDVKIPTKFIGCSNIIVNTHWETRCPCLKFVNCSNVKLVGYGWVTFENSTGDVVSSNLDNEHQIRLIFSQITLTVEDYEPEVFFEDEKEMCDFIIDPEPSSVHKVKLISK